MEKRKNLIIVNTYFQLITVINLVKNTFNNCENDLILSDISVNIEEKIKKLKEENLFNNINFINIKEIYAKNKLKKNFLYLIDRNKIINNCIDKIYDELIFYNYDILTYSIFDELYKKNPKIVCSRFDEGFIVYTHKTKIRPIVKISRFLFLKKNIEKYVKKMYLYHPELLCYDLKYKIEKIPNIDKNDIKLKRIYNNIFDYKKEEVKQKYVFFEEAFFSDKKDIDDLSLIKEIANVVGKENIIIKTHPRNKINRFDSLGIKTWKGLGMPWEVIQMNEDYSDKIFLSITSGSIMASRLYFNENIKSYYLFNCTNKKPDLINKNHLLYLEKFKKYLGSNITIPQNKKEFFEYLKKDI